MFDVSIKRLQGASLQQKLIKALYEGYTINEACGNLQIDAAALALSRRSDENLDQQIREAQAYRTDLMVDKLEDIATYEPDPKMAKVLSDNIKWLASKRMREHYGDRIDHNHNVSININDALEDAKNRTLTVIEHEPDKSLETQDIIDVESDDVDPLS